MMNNFDENYIIELVKKELSNGKLAHVKIKDYQLQHPLYFIYRKGDPKYYIYEKIFQSLT